MLSWLEYMRWAGYAAVVKATFLDWTLVVLLLLGILAHWAGTRTFAHFRRRGLPFARPLPFVGNLGPSILASGSDHDLVLNLYKQHEGCHASGFFQLLRPTLFLRDPQLISKIMVDEFDHFVDHQEMTTDDGEKLFAKNIYSLKGQKWRDVRTTLSPIFTSSKMRKIFKLINICGDQMVRFLKRKTKLSEGGVYEVEMKDFFTHFANDVIATSAFGIDCDSLTQPKNEFYTMGRNITAASGIRALIFKAYLYFSPKIMQFLGIPPTPAKCAHYFNNIVHGTIRERQQTGFVRPDLLQLLMQARDGELRADANDETESVKGGRTIKLAEEHISAQAFGFFWFGFDTVSTTLSFAADALARHPHLQERMQDEVDEVIHRHGGQLTYEAMQELKYADMFISEVLRLYTPQPYIDRVCTKDFTIPAQGGVPAYTVRKGDAIWIPVYPIHKDPKYWDDPDTFDPDRFKDENRHKIKPCTYMPFGAGPRICPGTQFALTEVKVALAHILRHFRFLATSKTVKKVEYAPNDFSGNIKGGCWVGIMQRNP